MVCVGCESEARQGAASRKSIVMSITPLLYRRGNSRKLKAGRRLNVCEDCFAAFVAGGGGKRACKVQTALRNSLSGCYNAAIAGELRP